MNSYKHHAAMYLLANHLFQQDTHQALHIYDKNGVKQTLEKVLQGEQKVIWNKSSSNEFGRLAQGNKYGVKMQDAMDFIHKYEVPPNKKVTYASFVLDYRSLKSKPYRVRLVVGGDCLPYKDDAGFPAASLIETKILVNSVISDSAKGAYFMSLDLKDFFLQSTMKNPEYMQIHIKTFRQI